MNFIFSKMFRFVFLASTCAVFSCRSAFAFPECQGSFCEEQSLDLFWFQKDTNAQAVWAPFGTVHPGSKSFQQWVRKSTSGQRLPDFRNDLSLNCWEYVLYVAAKFNLLSTTQIREIVDARLRGENLSSVVGNSVGNVGYSVKNGKVKARWPESTLAGDVVFMDETSHVVQATGKLDSTGRMEVISFSPRPIWGDGGATWPQPGTKPQTTTLESLIEELIELYPDVPTDWNSIDLKVVRLKQKDSP